MDRYKIFKYIKPHSLWVYTFKTANRDITIFSLNIYLYNGFAVSLTILNFGVQINFYDSDKVLLKRYGIKTTVTKDKIIYSKVERPVPPEQTTQRCEIRCPKCGKARHKFEKWRVFTNSRAHMDFNCDYCDNTGHVTLWRWIVYKIGAR